MKEPNKQRFGWLTIVAVVVGTLCAGGFGAYTVARRATLTRAMSAHQALMAEVYTQLELHHHHHGVYPRNLSELHITKYHDGATPAMIHQFRYESDGATFTLAYVSVTSGHITVLRPNLQSSSE